MKEWLGWRSWLWCLDKGRDAQVGASLIVPPVEMALLVGSGLAALARDNHKRHLNVP